MTEVTTAQDKTMYERGVEALKKVCEGLAKEAEAASEAADHAKEYADRLRHEYRLSCRALDAYTGNDEKPMAAADPMR